MINMVFNGMFVFFHQKPRIIKILKFHVSSKEMSSDQYQGIQIIARSKELIGVAELTLRTLANKWPHNVDIARTLCDNSGRYVPLLNYYPFITVDPSGDILACKAIMRKFHITEADTIETSNNSDKKQNSSDDSIEHILGVFEKNKEYICHEFKRIGHYDFLDVIPAFKGCSHADLQNAYTTYKSILRRGIQ